MQAKVIVKTPAIEGAEGKTLMLFDEKGRLLAGQVGCEIASGLNEDGALETFITVTFQVDGDKVRFA
ncbi:MAG: hypothetical protein KIS96_11665 [Bauldia sp.]|nr:hypothetical protein [Bauldia sp.]MCW5777492.1 hypothetical protein [Phycisphaeraceae bacterium]